MPTVNQFLGGFNIYKNILISGWILRDIEIKEENIVRWNEYQYPIQLTFERTLNSKSTNNLERQLYLHIGDRKIIRTDSNRPYVSEIKFVSIHQSNNFTVIKLLGHSKRVSENIASKI